MKVFRLPNGEMTKDISHYLLAWRKLSRPLERLTGMRHTAFDPDVHFDGYGKSISLPIWFLELINDSLRGKTPPKHREKKPNPNDKVLHEWLKTTKWPDKITIPPERSKP